MAIIPGTPNADRIFAPNDPTNTGNLDAGNDFVLGGTAKDNINGGSGNDFIDGNPGDDILSGQAGVDVLIGGDGQDVLRGGVDEDYLIGGADNDRLIGGPGDDFLTGGAGNDIFVFNDDENIGIDFISDFTPAVDKIQIGGIGFGLPVGALPAGNFTYDPITGNLNFSPTGNTIAKLQPNIAGFNVAVDINIV